MGDRDRHDVHMRDRDDYLGCRDERSDRRSRSRSRSRSNSRDRDKAMRSQIIIETNKHHALSDFEKLCDAFYDKLNDEFIKKNGRLKDYNSVKHEINKFYLDYARANATTIVKDYLKQLPKSNHHALLMSKARGWLRNNDFADVKVKLNDADVEALILRIYEIFEIELTKQHEKQSEEALTEMLASSSLGTKQSEEALTEMLASTSLGTKAKGNKTYRRNKTYRHKKPYNNNKKTYRRKKK